MIVTIDEARVGYPSIKLDGMELARYGQVLHPAPRRR